MQVLAKDAVPTLKEKSLSCYLFYFIYNFNQYFSKINKFVSGHFKVIWLYLILDDLH